MSTCTLKLWKTGDTHQSHLPMCCVQQEEQEGVCLWVHMYTLILWIFSTSPGFLWYFPPYSIHWHCRWLLVEIEFCCIHIEMRSFVFSMNFVPNKYSKCDWYMYTTVLISEDFHNRIPPTECSLSKTLSLHLCTGENCPGPWHDHIIGQ